MFTIRKKLVPVFAVLSMTLSPQVSFALMAAEEFADPLPDIPDRPLVDEALTSFRQFISVPTIDIVVPTVVELPLDIWISDGDEFLVREVETASYLNHYYKFDKSIEKTESVVSTSPVNNKARYMSDGRVDTYANFTVPETGYGEVTIKIDYEKPITTDRLNLRLAQYVSLPNTIKINYRSLDNSSALEEVVSTRMLNGTSISFPEITARSFEVTFTHSQLLRIAEISLNNKIAQIESTQTLRFLAQPGRSYEIYFDADRPVSVIKKESGNLALNDGVLKLENFPVRNNYYYKPADIDGDGIEDLFDNCVRESNPDQLDMDENGRGDVCDDWDRDGVYNIDDNCVNEPNQRQADIDGDGIGDACDEEESRFTEANPWVPWVGMGGAAFVLLILFVMVAKAPKPESPTETKMPDSENQE